MKNYLLTVLTSLAIAQSAFSQTTNESSIASIEKARQEIKNSIADLHIIEKVKDSSGYRNIYVRGSELILTNVYQKDQNIEKNVEWYFSNGQLIYAEQIWTDTKTEKIIDNQKFYILNEQLISWIKTDNKVVDNNSQEFKDLGNQLAAYSYKLKEDLK